MDGSDIFWVFSSPFFFWPPPHLFQAGVAGRQQPGAKQHRPWGPYSIAVVLRLIKMQIRHHFVPYREIFRPYSWYTWDIRVTFQVHSKYILGIPAAFCLNSWTLEPYLAAIPRAFWLHSYNIRGTFQLDFKRYSDSHRTGIWSAFWTLWQHSKYAYCVLPNYIRAAFGMCKNRSILVRSEFLVFERHSSEILLKMTYPPECDSTFKNCSFRLVPFHSFSVWRGF